MKITIRARLFLLVAVMLVLAGVLGTNAHLALGTAGTNLAKVTRTSRALRNHMEGDMMHDALRADVLAALLAATPADWEAVHQDLLQHSRHFREMIEENNQLAPDETRVALRSVDSVLDKYIRNAEALVAAAKTDKAAAKALLADFLASFQDLEGRLAHVSDGIESSAAAAQRVAQTSIDRAQVVGGIIVSVALIVALTVSFLIVRAITSGITSLSAVIQRMERGELGRTITIDRHDEFGRLMISVRETDARLSEIVSSVQASAQAVSEAARELAQGNDDLSHRTQMQAAALEETAASMEQMAATVKHNADSTRAANQVAIDARDQADRGGMILR